MNWWCEFQLIDDRCVATFYCIQSFLNKTQFRFNFNLIKILKGWILLIIILSMISSVEVLYDMGVINSVFLSQELWRFTVF